MVKKFVVGKGSKGTEDKVIRVWSDGDVLTVEDVLRWLAIVFHSEDSCHPKPRYEGSCMLMKAILEVYSGLPIKQVLKKYKLKRKQKTRSIWVLN